MADGDKAFTGSIPAIYQTYLTPMIFAPFAEDLAGRLRIDGRGRILELAAGTGALTCAIAKAAPSASIVATDINAPMLQIAATIAPETVALEEADACALPFGDQSFDAVVCQFGVMFFPDKPAAFRHARRVIAEDGLFLFNLWDKLEANPLTATVSAAMTLLFPDDPPLFFERLPHGFHDPDPIAAMLKDAGFARVEIDRVQRTARAPTARTAAFGLCQGTPLRNEIEARGPERLEEATGVAEEAIAARFGAGPIEADMSALVVTASTD